MGRYLPCHLSAISIHRDKYGKNKPILYRDTIPGVASHVTPTWGLKIAQSRQKIVEKISMLLYNKTNVLNLVKLYYTSVIY